MRRSQELEIDEKQTRTRRMIYYVAMSADGFIARPDGDIAWLDAFGGEDYGYAAFMKEVNAVVMGRKTYDFVKAHAPAGGDDGETETYVMSNTLTETGSAEVVRSEAVPELVARLRAGSGGDVFVMGGGASVAALLDAGGLDELRVFVMPVLLGEGIPLIAPARRDVALRLLDEKRFGNGVVELHYQVDLSEEAAAA